MGLVEGATLKHGDTSHRIPLASVSKAKRSSDIGKKGLRLGLPKLPLVVS